MTARDDLLERRGLEHELVEELSPLRGCSLLPVSPLEDQRIRTLTQELLLLDEGLAEQVVARAEGIPLFAVQLMDDWIGQGDLVLSDEGRFHLRPGHRLRVPDDIHSLWRDRLDHVLVAQPPHARRLLQLAAALGQAISAEEWRRAAEQLGLEVSAGLVDALLKGGLARAGQGSDWTFAHGLLRDSLERDARASRHWPTLNAACARALEALYGEGAHRRGTGVEERCAGHLIEAGHLQLALRPLMLAAGREVEPGTAAPGVGAVGAPAMGTRCGGAQRR